MDVPPSMATKHSQRLQLIGVVHVESTPGSPGYAVLQKLATKRQSAWERVVENAVLDAQALVAGGCDALIVENFGDTPFWKDNVPSETIAALALVIDAVQREVKGQVQVGVNVLRNDARAALGLCAASGAGFLRVNVHIGAAVTDQGLVEGRAAETLRERERLCPWAKIWADVHVKHATPLGRETIAEAAQDTFERGRADALIVSGVATGRAPDPERIQTVRAAVPRAVIYVGSGLSEKNAAALLAHADGAIVGTALKFGGKVEARVDAERVLRLRELFNGLRATP